jgi:tetratricopeptide (TPR) repeat protein
VKNVTLTVIMGFAILLLFPILSLTAEQSPQGLVFVRGGFTEGIGVHVIPGWVLVDKTVITGHTQVSVASINYFDTYVDNLRYLAINSQASSVPQLVWLEVPGLRESPVAMPHSNRFIPGDRLSAYDGRLRRDLTIYQISAAKDGHETGIERAKGFPITIHLLRMDGPSLADAHPIFDSTGSWAGFLIKELPQPELCAQERKNPSLFSSLCREGIPEKPWFTNADLMNMAPTRIPYTMNGFPFRSFSLLLSGKEIPLEHRDNIGRYCVQNPDDPWGWYALGLAQIEAGASSDGIASLYRAEKLLPESSLITWQLAETLNRSLAFEQALPFYERALKSDPSIDRRHLGDIYHVLGDHDKESSLLYGENPQIGKKPPHTYMDYSDWLINHNRHSEVESWLFNDEHKSRTLAPYDLISPHALTKLLEIYAKLGRTRSIAGLFNNDFDHVTGSAYRNTLVWFWTQQGQIETKMDVFRKWLDWDSKDNGFLYALPKSILEKLYSTDRKLIRAAIPESAEMMEWLYYKLDRCEPDLLEERNKIGFEDSSSDPLLQVQCLQKLGRTKDAIRFIEKLSKQKDNTNYKRWAGRLWWEVGRLEQARDAYLARLADGEDSWRTYRVPGELYQELKQKEQAVEAYRQELRGRRKELTHASSTHAFSFVTYANDLEFMKKIVQLDMEEDVVEFARALFLQGHHLDIIGVHTTDSTQIIDFLFSLHAGDLAAYALRNTLAETPGDADTWHLLGKTYLRLGDKAEAAVCLRRLKALQSELAAELENEIANSMAAKPASVP